MLRVKAAINKALTMVICSKVEIELKAVHKFAATSVFLVTLRGL